MSPWGVSTGKVTFHVQHLKPRNRLCSVWGFPTREETQMAPLICLRDPRCVLSTNRNTSVTASGVAPGLQKWPGDPLLAACVPTRESHTAAPLWRGLNRLFVKSPESRLWHEVPISCPVPMTSQGSADVPGPSPVSAISASHSGFLITWGQSLSLVFLI